MDDRALPVLWLFGPPGVGKSTVAWELFVQLSRDGIPTGYVDIDQLGICYAAPTSRDWAPEPLSDLGRHRMKARNLDAVVANFRYAGARCVIVSGVVDPARGVDADLVPRAALTLCRLRCEPDELRRRLTGRGRPHENVDEVLRHADALDNNGLPGICIDTTGRSVVDVLRLVRELTGGWPGLAGPAVLGNEAAAPVSAPGDFLWLCGATAVGKSTVGWQVYRQVRLAGVRAAFVDLDQIGFHRPVPDGDPGNHRLKAGNLAAIWRTYRDTGAQCLIVVGPVDDPDSLRQYTLALPAATITLCRLHASRDQLAERIVLRGRGHGPGIAGDALTGRPPALLRHATARAAADAEALERAGIGGLRIDTDGRDIPDIAQEILLRVGWPLPAGRDVYASPASRAARE